MGPPTMTLPSSSSSAVSSQPKQTRYPVYLPQPPPSSSSSPRRSVSDAQSRMQRRAIIPSTPLRSPTSARESTPLLSSPPQQHSRHRPQPQLKATPALVPQIPPRHGDLPKPGQSSRQRLQDCDERRSSGSAPPRKSIASTESPVPRPAPKPVSPPTPAKRKPFYRPRPLWLVPFAVIAALVRGMTLAPRVEVYTQLACYSLYPPQTPGNHLSSSVSSPLDVEWSPSSAISLYSSLDPLGPHLFPAPQIQRDRISRDNDSSEFESFLSSPSHYPLEITTAAGTAQDPRTLPSHRCLTDPAVQASAARLQTLMTTTMGLLSALTTTFWGRFSQTHGRTRVLAISTFGLFFTDLIFILTSTPNLPWPLSLLEYSPWQQDGASRWSRYKHHLLLLGPIVEGTLGGWTTLQSATSAYISDCTSVGSRAGIFAKFTGVFYTGFSIGPMIAGYIVRHPEMVSWWSSPSSANHRRTVGALAEVAAKQRPSTQSVTSVFWVAIVCSFINFLLVLFVFPESLDKEKMQKAAQEAEDAKGKGREREGEEGDEALMSPLLPIVEDVEGVGGGDGFVDVEDILSPTASSSSSMRFGRSPRAHRLSTSSSVPPKPSQDSPNAARSFLNQLMQPLAVFLPVEVTLPTRNGLLLKRQRDWSLSLLALGLAGWMLSTGVYQIKYLYAEHVYGWGAEELSLYISWMGAVRAIVLLWGVPAVVGWLKGRVAELETKATSNKMDVKGKQRATDQDEHHQDTEGHKRTPPTRLQLGKSIRFDLRLARLSLFIDLVSNLLIAITPSPAFHAESIKYYFTSRVLSAAAAGQRPVRVTHEQSQAMFVAASSLSALGGGLVPAVHSLALCIVQARGLEPDFGISGYGVRDADGVVEPFIGHHDMDVEHGVGGGYGTMGGPSRASSVASSSMFIGRGASRSTFRGSVVRAAAAGSSSQVVDSGTLFGAFAVLQALGQMILGPMLFGLVYSSTVARYPKAVFVLSSALLLGAFGVLLAVRNPVGEVRVERRQRKFREMMDRTVSSKLSAAAAQQRQKKRSQEEEAERLRRLQEMKRRKWEMDLERRGRSVVSKDLRGGAVVPASGSFVGPAMAVYGSYQGPVGAFVPQVPLGAGVGVSESGAGGAGMLSLSYREERALVTRSA